MKLPRGSLRSSLTIHTYRMVASILLSDTCVNVVGKGSEPNALSSNYFRDVGKRRIPRISKAHGDRPRQAHRQLAMNVAVGHRV